MDLKGTKHHEAGENCVMRSFTICTIDQISLKG